MIRKSLMTAMVFLFLFTAPAFALKKDYRPYLTVGGGFTIMQETEQTHDDTVTFANGPLTISSDQGFNSFIATGKSYDEGRLEFSLGYNQAEFKEYEDSAGTVDLEGNLKVASFLMSLFWDFNTDGVVSPYVGLGIGVCHIKMDDSILGENRDAATATQLGLGVSFDLGKNVQLDLGYKMLGVIEPNLGPINPGYVIFHNGNAAFRFLY